MNKLKPNSSNGNCDGKWTKIFFNLSPMWIWQITSLISSAHVSLNNNLTGCVLTISTLESVLMIFCSLLIYLALEKQTPGLSLPWLFSSIYNVYQYQLPTINRISKMLVITKSGAVPWIVFSIHSFCLFIRMYVMVRIIWWIVQTYIDKRVHEKRKREDEQCCTYIG